MAAINGCRIFMLWEKERELATSLLVFGCQKVWANDVIISSLWPGIHNLGSKLIKLQTD